MLHRREGDSLVLITQPAHAWLSGQLASAWGNRENGIDPVTTEVRLAAEQHDTGWLDWETHPTLNPDTGLPHTFSQLPTLQHLDVWSMSTPRALSYGFLPATLISMHGTYLYERFHDFESDTDDEARAARDFLEREEAFQRSALRHIQSMYGLDTAQVQELRRFVSTWDAMSLAICMGVPGDRQFSGIPTSGGDIDIRFSPDDDELTAYSVSPWPFSTADLLVMCEGRRVDGTFEAVEQMRDSIRSAPPVRLEFRLFPG